MLPVLALVGLFQATQLAAAPRSGDTPHTAPANMTTAVRAATAPVIDGSDGDAVWATATPITAFREWRPTEDAEPRFRTEAKIAYDAANLYVFVRAFDPHPCQIITADGIDVGMLMVTFNPISWSGWPDLNRRPLRPEAMPAPLFRSE